MSAMVHPAAMILSGMAKWISGADVQWLWRPTEPRPRVYFANHSSHLDALVLLAVLPAPIRSLTHPVAAQEYWQGSRLRSFLAARVFGSVLVPRSSGALFAGRAILSSLLRELERGCSLILFPEGKRGTGERIADFKSGLYQLCRERSGLEAVPVYLENLNRVLPKGRLLPSPSRSRVIFGSPLSLQPGETRPGFLQRARQALQDLRNR
jgi:1-acyl-sn-glycerol-3-phosphate acyltransferase